MRLLGQILLALLVISALQGVVAVLTVGIVLALVIGLILRPSETIPLLLLFGILACLDAHPWAMIGAIGAISAVFLVASRVKRVSKAPPLGIPLLPTSDRGPADR